MFKCLLLLLLYCNYYGLCSKVKKFQPKYTSSDLLGGECRYEDFGEDEYVGVGATCNVYKMYHKPTGKYFAIKKLDEDIDERAVELEEELQHDLRHPNIAPIHCTVQIRPGQYGFVMDFYKNGDLTKLLYTFKQIGSPNKDQALKIAAQLLFILWELHKLGIGHYDIKPDNILIDDDFTVRLADFGSARLNQSYKAIKQQWGGCIAYQPPEIKATKNDSSSLSSFGLAADYYSLALIINKLIVSNVLENTDQVVELLDTLVIFDGEERWRSLHEKVDQIKEWPFWKEQFPTSNILDSRNKRTKCSKEL